jgi:hypothetical protein
MVNELHLISKRLKNKHKPILNRTNELSFTRDTFGIALLFPMVCTECENGELIKGKIFKKLIHFGTLFTFPRDNNRALMTGIEC